MSGDRAGPKTAIAKMQTPGDSRYVVVTFTRDNHYIRTTPVAVDVVDRYYQFARQMAPFMLLNDLLASDVPIPRLGCSRAADVQLRAVAGILPEIKRAFMSTPDQDPATLALALAAYRQFSSSSEARSNSLTRQTTERLGSSPDASLVYRDTGAEGHRRIEYVVVRLSKGHVRTYAMMTVDGGKPRMSSPGLCEVGDTRCANDYQWP